MSVFKKFQKQKAQAAADKQLLELAKKQLGKEELTPEEAELALKSIKSGAQAMQMVGKLLAKQTAQEDIVKEVSEKFDLPEEMIWDMIKNPNSFTQGLK